MKLLLVHEHYRTSAPSGENTVFENEREMLGRSGVELAVHEVFNDDIDVSTLWKRIRLGVDTIWCRESYRNMSRLIRTHQPDIAHFHNTFPLLSPSVYAACRDAGVAVVQTLHNFRLICPGGLLLRDNQPCESCISGSLLSSLRYRCYRDSFLATAPLTGMIAYNRLRRSYDLVDRFVALTEFSASRFVAAGFDRARIAIKPNFLPRPPQPCFDKQDYAVFVGRLTPEKGIETLLKAWREVPGLPLKILGDGELKPGLEKYARDHGLAVEFYGAVRRERVYEVVRSARMQIIPSECYEGFPMALLEAFACATPVVVSSGGSMDELVDDPETGFRFQSGNAADLAATVNRAAASGSRLRVVAASARAQFEAQYTEVQNMHMLNNLYSELTE